MENPLNPSPSLLERLSAQVNELERRVYALEHPQGQGSLSGPQAAPLISGDHPLEGLSSVRSGTIPAIGKMFLGIAGAYLLRAVSESGMLPQMAVVAIAIAYAGSWLVWAFRTRDTGVVSAMFATTAALIFSTMVWELTLRFKVLPDALSAAMLVGFVLLASALAWKHRLTTVVWTATLFPAITAAMLLVSTRDPAPFALALLSVAALTECSGLHARWSTLRPVVALLADVAILVLILIYSGQAGFPSEYKPLISAVLVVLASSLFLIYGTSVAISTVGLGRTIGVFDIAQVIVAFLLAFVNIRRATHDGEPPLLAVFCLLAGAMCYFATFAHFDDSPQPRNYHVFGAWGAVFVLIGTSLFSKTAASLCLGLAAVVAVFAAVTFHRWILAFHGAVYLLGAGFFSGLWSAAARVLVGPWPAPFGWRAWPTVVSAVICCATMWRALFDDSEPHMRNPRNHAALRLFFSWVIAYAGTALLVRGTVSLVAGGSAPAAPTLAVIRTLAVCAMIFAFIFVGTRLNHAELVWIAYAAIAFCTLKLLFEDLREGTAASLAISLFLYGTIWVLVPRLVRSARRRC